MAIVNVSLNTDTRQVILTINGVLVPTDECSMDKYVYDGEEKINFSYSVENVDGSGMKERRYFYLPSPEELAAEVHSELNGDGLASKAAFNKEKAKSDTIDFLNQHRNCQQDTGE